MGLDFYLTLLLTLLYSLLLYRLLLHDHHIWFILLIGWSVCACLPWLLQPLFPPSSPSHANLQVMKWVGQMGTVLFRGLAVGESYHGLTIHLGWKLLRHLMYLGLFLALMILILYLPIPIQPTLRPYLVLTKIKDLSNLLLGSWLLITLASMWVNDLGLGKPWGRRERIHALLLSLLCLSVPVADFAPAYTRAQWMWMFAIRSVFQYLIIIIWISRSHSPSNHATSNAS